MCNINQNRELDAQLLGIGLNLIGTAIEASLRENRPMPTTDVLATATTAYTQGKITKNQLMAVINALDEQTYQTRAYAEPEYNQTYRKANAYLNQYRR